MSEKVLDLFVNCLTSRWNRENGFVSNLLEPRSGMGRLYSATGHFDVR